MRRGVAVAVLAALLVTGTSTSAAQRKLDRSARIACEDATYFASPAVGGLGAEAASSADALYTEVLRFLRKSKTTGTKKFRKKLLGAENAAAQQDALDQLAEWCLDRGFEPT